MYIMLITDNGCMQCTSGSHKMVRYSTCNVNCTGKGMVEYILVLIDLNISTM